LYPYWKERLSKLTFFMKTNLRIFFKGMIMGIAEIIPGVSGGTIALILGIYERLIRAIANINIVFVNQVLKGNLNEAWKYSDASFLFFLVLGMLVAAFSFSSAIIFLSENFPFFLKSFFSGLLLTSLFFKPLKPEKIHRRFLIGFLLASLIVGFAWSLPPNELKEISLIYFFFGGFVAVCAFILPGISGSFILLLLGLYQAVILSLKELDLLVLSSLFSGCLLGLLLFIRIVKKAYENYPEYLMGFFYSLVLLSIPLLWKSGAWIISLPKYQLGYLEALFGLGLGVFFIFLLQKISSTFQDI